MESGYTRPMALNPPDLRPDRATIRALAEPSRPGQPRIGMVSLGCPKALVDSERILTRLRAEGYAISPSYDGADLVVINTCGFIESAVNESDAGLSIWTLTTGEAGMRTQVRALAEFVGGRIVEKTMHLPAPWRYLPFVLGPAALGVDEAGKPLAPPWPDLVISCGRRSVPRSRNGSAANSTATIVGMTKIPTTARSPGQYLSHWKIGT